MELLKGKVAIVFGASGAIGGAVAQAFASAGSAVVLVGRTKSKLSERVETISKFSQATEIEVADVFDAGHLAQMVESVKVRHRKIDIVFNAISSEDEQGKSLVEMPNNLIMKPIENLVLSHLNITKAVTPHMIQQGHGTVLGITANAALGSKNVGGFGIACSAVESLFRQFTKELSPNGIRFNLIRSSGSPEAPGLNEVFDLHAKALGISRAEFETQMAADIPLRRFPKLSEISKLAVFLASDLASPMTGAILNATGGDCLD